MARGPKNLFLDSEVVRRAERYAEEHGTTLSGLVGDLLSRVPEEPGAVTLSPAVRRLLGAGVPPDGRPPADHAEHLWQKYGHA